MHGFKAIRRIAPKEAPDRHTSTVAMTAQAMLCKGCLVPEWTTTFSKLPTARQNGSNRDPQRVN
jgi:hypothetical protein